MVNRGVAILGLVALSPAHASLIEYSFTSTVSNLGGNVHQDFGVEVGDTITGGFLFDDTAARTSFKEDLIVGNNGWATGTVSTSIYNMGNVLLWAMVGDQRLATTGNDLLITDAATHVNSADVWRLHASGSGEQVNGYVVDWMEFCLREWFIGPLTSSELQVSDAAEWGYGGVLDRWFGLSFADGSSIYGTLDSITRTPGSVPEPGTLSLLAAGALGAFAARRRRRAAAL